MKDLLKVAVVMALLFASTFVLMNSKGLVTEAGVTTFLNQAHDIHPVWLAAIAIALLMLDLLIAIPTITTILLAGYFMGPLFGGLASAAGLMLLGNVGYAAGNRFGRPVLMRLFKGEERLSGIEAAFAKNDLLVLFVCQALPILPELSCTLAGISRMRFWRFFLGYAVGVVPFAFIVAYAGSVSTPSNPGPAICAAIGVSAALLILWTLVQRRSA